VAGDVLQDLSAAPGVVLDHRPRHTPYIGRPLGHGLPPEAQALGQLAAQHRLVQVARRFGLAIEVSTVQGRMPATGALGEVAHHHMGVKQRVARTRGAMDERRPDKPAAAHLHQAAVAAPGTARLTLETPQRLADRRVMPGAQLIGDVARRGRPQHADRLRRTERQVEPGDRAGGRRPSQTGAVQQRREPPRVDLARDAELLSPAAHPGPGRLALTGV
jgi:hypothetical protein